MVIGIGQLVVDLLDYLVTKYPTSLVSLLFGSVISTFCICYFMIIESFSSLQ